MLRKSYTAADIAAALGVTERGVRKMADTNGWKYTWKKSRGPACKVYLLALLPEEIRIKIARSTASDNGAAPSRPVVAPGVDAATLSGVGARAGACLGRDRAADLAESAERLRLNRERGIVNFAQLPEPRQAEANARLEVLQARDAFCKAARLPLKRGSQSFANEYVAGHLRLPKWVTETVGPSLSWSSLNRWQQDYNEFGLAGLAKGYKAPNKGNTTLTPAQREVVQGLVIDHPRITLIKIMEALAARFTGEAIPHAGSVRRYLHAWKDQHHSLLLNRENPDFYRSSRQLAWGSASEQIDRLNQRWEFDSTVGDVMLTDGRHCVIGVIDVYSRRVKLLVSKSSTATAVAALTRAAILDWGVPETAKTDNGSDYVSKHLVRVFEGLEITQYLCDPFQPQQKPHIERFFKTYNHGICELLPGFVGHSVADRKAIESRRSFAQRMIEGGEPVEIKLSAAEFQQITDRWVNAIYHQNPHAGLQGQTPAQAARAWTQPVRRISDERALDLLLSEAPGNNGLRTVGKQGISVDGVWYQAPEFAGMISQVRQVRVTLDAADLGAVHCYDPDNGYFICVAVDPIRKGIDRAEMAAKGRAIEKQVLRDGGRELKRIAKSAATEGIYQEILAHRESLVANTLELPKMAVDYTTPALEEAGRAAEAMVGKAKEPIQLSEAEFAHSEVILAELERKSGIRLAMPASEYEASEMLLAERESGLPLSDAEERWLLEYEKFLETGRRVGLLAEGWQPYGERAKIAREATNSN